MYRRILLVNEGTLDANGAFELSLLLASRFDAELHMILVEELSRFPVTIGEVVGEKRAADQRSAYIVASVQRRAKEANVKFRSHVVIGRLIDRVIEFVNENQIDLLVLGRKNDSRVPFPFLRSFSRTPHPIGAVRGPCREVALYRDIGSGQRGALSFEQSAGPTVENNRPRLKFPAGNEFPRNCRGRLVTPIV